VRHVRQTVRTLVLIQVEQFDLVAELRLAALRAVDGDLPEETSADLSANYGTQLRQANVACASCRIDA
jgi:hypothetical protein